MLCLLRYFELHDLVTDQAARVTTHRATQSLFALALLGFTRRLTRAKALECLSIGELHIARRAFDPVVFLKAAEDSTDTFNR